MKKTSNSDRDDSDPFACDNDEEEELDNEFCIEEGEDEEEDGSGELEREDSELKMETENSEVKAEI